MAAILRAGLRNAPLVSEGLFGPFTFDFSLTGRHRTRRPPSAARCLSLRSASTCSASRSPLAAQPPRPLKSQRTRSRRREPPTPPIIASSSIKEVSRRFLSSLAERQAQRTDRSILILKIRMQTATCRQDGLAMARDPPVRGRRMPALHLRDPQGDLCQDGGRDGEWTWASEWTSARDTYMHGRACVVTFH